MNSDNIKILKDMLPYIHRFAGITVVVKYGGHAMVDDQLKEDFASDVTIMKLLGIALVVIHGGGPQINSVLDQVGIVPKFVKGMRITDEQTMDVVEMVLCGKINKEVVAQINRQNGRAVGISGKDASLVYAEKLNIKDNKTSEIINLGLVGKVEHINPEIVNTLIEHEFIPIIAPVGIGEEGKTYNINADLVATEIAIALCADQLILITDVDGIIDISGHLLSSINKEEAKKMIEDEVITGGMIPKINCALESLNNGVEKVQIINGKKSHALLNSFFTDKGVGTTVEL
mmetsp:Transcript_1625/g.1115  ORF Transcript_1625/g.1115 Transcript_1625/m.1115 type:complete len:288 (+) Transcript_1625:1464-2327(+)